MEELKIEGIVYGIEDLGNNTYDFYFGKDQVKWNHKKANLVKMAYWILESLGVEPQAPDQFQKLIAEYCET